MSALFFLILEYWLVDYNKGMFLKVDGTLSNEYQEGITIQDLLDMKDIEAVPWLVISVNGVFIKRDLFKSHILNDKDEIELIYVRGGG